MDGAIFRLIANDGRQSRMIMATAIINARINEIMRQRARDAERFGLQRLIPEEPEQPKFRRCVR